MGYIDRVCSISTPRLPKNEKKKMKYKKTGRLFFYFLKNPKCLSNLSKNATWMDIYTVCSLAGATPSLLPRCNLRLILLSSDYKM